MSAVSGLVVCLRVVSSLATMSMSFFTENFRFMRFRNFGNRRRLKQTNGHKKGAAFVSSLEITEASAEINAIKSHQVSSDELRREIISSLPFFVTLNITEGNS